MATTVKDSIIMSSHQLADVDRENDLGVTITTDLKPERQCIEAYLKTNKILGLIRWTITFKKPTTMIQLYKSLVRILLEYSSFLT